jgi:glycyl-tRNA synthetase beta chain
MSSVSTLPMSLSKDERRGKIQQGVKEAAQKLGGNAPMYSDLWEEVTNLVEWPTAVVGKFEPEFLRTAIRGSHRSDGDSSALLPSFQK